MFSRITVLAGSHANGETPNHLGPTEIEYCWAPGQLKARQAIQSRVKRLNPDLVWFNAGASIFGKSPWVNVSGLFTPMFVRQMGFPTVVTLHELVELTDLRALNAPGGPLAKVGAKALTKISSQADLICLTMKEYAEWLSMRGVDCTHIPIGAYNEPQLLDATDSQGLLFFSTLAPFKGIELLFSAFESLRGEYPQLTLTIAGTEHVRFPEYARQLKIRFGKMEKVNWLGQTSEDDVMELFRRAQIVVLPYSASTGSSSVLYQAATWGRSVVASDLVDIKKLVTESGLKVEFFKNGDASSLSAAIRSLVESKEKMVGQAAHNFRAIQRTRPHETCGQYIRAFNRALEKRFSPKRIAIPAAKEDQIA
jgi:glycosyltransferase involved in cell wall biosynthesis